jgi:mannose/cellobiose epimerase-like protein (N-acyl-D-glucosamine 2-epimerase family)
MALVCIATAAAEPPAGTTTLKPNSRIPLSQVRQHIDRDWLTNTITHGLVDYWVKYSVEPNGFIQENLDRNWKPWGTQREASVNGQGRQLLSMTLAYEMGKDPKYLDAIKQSADFLLKMKDPKYGGYYNRVSPDFKVIDDTKTGFQSFALYSLATAGRVTGNKEYLNAAMDLFRVIRDKMRDGAFIGSGSYTRDFSKPAPRAFGGNIGARGRGANANGPSAAEMAAYTGGVQRRHGINLHMFEALMGLYEATHSDEVWKEISSELDAISRLYDYDKGYLPESYDANWKGVGDPSRNPGHLFEWGSLLSHAVELGADPKFIELGSRSVDLGLKSYSDAVGGLGAFDRNGKPARMLWWPQCEVIKATATYATLHGRQDLWPYYQKTLDFVKKNYFDTESGGWFEAYIPGEPRSAQGDKAFIKGSVDGPEWGSYHQTMLFYELWRISAPDYKPWPAKKGA